MRIQRKKVYLTLVVLYAQVIFVHGQTEWVWGKSSNGNSNNNRPSGGNSRPVVSNNGPAGSNLVPVNTVTIFGNGAGIVSGPSGSSSASGDQYFATQTGSGSQPAVIVQVLQPGGSGSGLQSGGTGSSIPVSPVSGGNFPSSSSLNNNFSSPSSSSSNSNFPASPQSGSSLNNNDAIPSNSIRSVPPVQGEPRLFTKHLRNLFANAINNLVGRPSSSHSSSHSQNNGGLFPSGSSGTSNQGLINSLLQGLGNRFPTASPLPVSSSEFNTEGGGSSFNPGSSGSSFLPSSSGGGGNCKCVPDDQCRLPFTATGTCSVGTMCCRRSGTRTVSDYSDNTRTSSVRFQPAALRAGLFGEIVRGTSNVIDDTLDLILAPYLTQEDQHKLATRLASNRQS